MVRKPLFALTIAMILNGEELHFDDDTDKKEFDFIAPDANVLIVDDNAVNLTVAEGIMEPTTEPWGQRACYIADPEGNLVEIGSFVKE